MARRRYKLTGFTRLLFFLIIFTPLAYIGVSYYQGEDGIAKFKDVIGLESSNAEKPSVESTLEEEEEEDDDVLRLKDMEIAVLKERIKKLEAELEQKQKELDRSGSY